MSRYNPKRLDARTSELPYLVNDSKIDLSHLETKTLFVMGESHGNANDEKLVFELISKYKIQYVLVELLGDLVLLKPKDKQDALKLPIEDLYHHVATRRWVKHSLKFDAVFVGIESVDLDFENLSIKDQFALREQKFITMTDEYREKGRTIVVVGDTHLRSIKTKQLGDISPMYAKYINDVDAVIIRTKDREIE